MSNLVQLRAGNAIAPIVPTTIDEVFRLANGIAKSGLAPKGMSTSEQVSIALMTGLELGLPPMQAIQRIAVVNGRPTLWGDALPALLWARGFKIEEEVSDDGARCTIIRPDGTKITRTFTEKDARKAGLWGKAGPWTQYPQRMLQMRARGFAARDGAADVLAGLYLAEEMQDAEMKDITPAKPAQAALPDIPDFPDAVDELPPEDDAPIVDVQGFLANYREEFNALSGAERQEFIDGNADVVKRLPPEARKEIADLLEAAS
jgi:hypothetical protein